MALILAIETATPVCSAALFQDDRKIDLLETQKERSHAAMLTIYIQDLINRNHLTRSDLDTVAVSKGPGSYTGLRIGVSSAKGIAYGLNIPLIGISTLEILTQAIYSQYKRIAPDAKLCPMIDARRMEVYTAVYDSNGTNISPPEAKIITQDSFHDHLEGGPVLFFGSGASKCKSVLTHPNARFVDNIIPSANHMGSLAQTRFARSQFEDTAYFEPFYLKDFIATTPKNKVLGKQKKPPV